MDDTTTATHTQGGATTAASHILRNAFVELRQMYPFMNTGHLARLLAKVDGVLQAELSASEPAMEATKADFDFFKLPAELRNYIYELALARDEGDSFETQRSAAGADYRLDLFPEVKPSPLPSLLQVSQQLRAEALPVFFANTHFTATFASRTFSNLPTALVPDWLTMFDSEMVKNIQHLTIRFSASDSQLVTAQMLKISMKVRPVNTAVVKKVAARRPRGIYKDDVVDILRLEECGMKRDAILVTYRDVSGTRWREMQGEEDSKEEGSEGYSSEEASEDEDSEDEDSEDEDSEDDGFDEGSTEDEA